MTSTDILIVGAGPAGLAAAIEARKHQVAVTVVDDQPAPGGQIWRGVEARFAAGEAGPFGSAYVRGQAVVDRFRKCGATYLPASEVWQFEGTMALVKGPQGVHAIPARTVLLAVGAQERPWAFPGWTLPGVMTVGAAQILLKSSQQIPDGQVWIAGRGPLPLLYASQLIAAGGALAGYLDLDASGRLRKAARFLPGAFRNWRDLARGMAWTAKLELGRAPGRTRAKGLIAGGNGRLETLAWADAAGNMHNAPADVLLVHDSLIPSSQISSALGCRWQWNDRQRYQVLDRDDYNETSVPDVFGAGDCARIGGAEIAVIDGRIAALGALRKLGLVSEQVARTRLRDLKRMADRNEGFRRFLDALYEPAPDCHEIDGGTIVCRCENLEAGEIRRIAAHSRGLNQLKSATRACMGPCQGRQCADTVRDIMARTKGCSPEHLGQITARPPYRPITLGEIAALDHGPRSVERM